MDYLAGEVIALIRAHPDWAALIIGIVAFGESFVFLSLLFPGTAILIASGALVEAGILNPFLPVFAGILGAVETRSPFGWVRNLDPKFRMFGHFDIIRNDWKVGLSFLSATAQRAFSSEGSSDRSAL
jgi:hypothetical protein